jgi:hypothetical protein
LFILIFVGCSSIASLLAEFLRPALPSLPSGATLPDQVSSARLASVIAPFRSDLKEDYAVALSSQALDAQYAVRPGTEEAAQAAQEATRNALQIGPHDSRLWLILALLQSKSDKVGPRAVESLKMSYLTGPNQAVLIPIRLAMVTANSSLKDADLGELARGDVRAMLSQRPEQRLALVNDYARGSDIGKKFLEESARTIDPKFADSLRNKNFKP